MALGVPKFKGGLGVRASVRRPKPRLWIIEAPNMRFSFVFLGLATSVLLWTSSIQAQPNPALQTSTPKTGQDAPDPRAQAPRPRLAPDEDDVTPMAGQMTEGAANAKRLFDAERWPEAALQYKRVVDGTTRDDEGNRQIAQYHLAVALYRLQFYQASFAIFSEIADKPKHLEFRETLNWLAKLASQLPEPADVIERIGKYESEQITRFDNPAQEKIYWQLNYLLGRYKYRNRDYDRAIELFGKVDPRSKYYVHAQFFTGIGHVQTRKSAPALEAFQRVVQTLDTGIVDVDDATRLRDLAHLSMARTYYSASIRFNDKGVPAIDRRNISAAIRSWDRVDQTSEYWLDAVFEESWAYFLAGDFALLLGNIHTIESPYFPRAFYPEADVLRAIVSYTVCHYDEATMIIAKMKNKYMPVKTELEKLRDRFSGDDSEEKYFQFLQEVRAGKSNLSAPAKSIVENMLSDRQLLLYLDYLRVIDEEKARFDKAPEAFRTSSLGYEINDSLLLARALTIRHTGAMTRERYLRYLDELGAHLRNGNNILLEMNAKQRRKLEEPVNIGYMMQRDPYLYGQVKPDDEHILWPFDGEYWRDELGYYRQVVKSRCGP